MLTKQKGDVALGVAISYFIVSGYEVSLPIGDKRDYDLIIEKNGELSRVQVKHGGLYQGRTKCRVISRSIIQRGTILMLLNFYSSIRQRVKSSLFPGKEIL